MKHPWTTLAIALACSTLTLGTLTGCEGVESDSAQADRRVEAAAAQADAAPDAAAARAILEQAVAETTASPVGRARAKSLLAAVEVDAATDVMRDLDQVEIEIASLAYDLSQRASLISASNVLTEHFAKLEPATSLADARQRIAAIQGGADQADWIVTNGARIPTLSHVKQEISRLEGQIAQTQEKIKQARAQRVQLLEQAEAGEARSNQLQGNEALAAYNEASELRKQAAERAILAEQLEASLLPLNADLAVAQGQQRVLSAAIEHYQQQAKTFEESWAQTQEQIAAAQELRTQALSGTATPDADLKPEVDASVSVAEKAERLNQARARAEQLRSNAETALTNAVKLYADAAQAAQQLASDLRKRETDAQLPSNAPQVEAWRQLAETINPTIYRLQQAVAEQRLATLYAGRAGALAAQLKAVNELQAAAQKAGTKLPAGVPDANTIDAELKTARELASQHYAEADELLINIIQGTAPRNLKTQANISRTINNYAWATLARQAGDEATAKERLQVALESRAEVPAGTPLPPLPQEIAGAAQPAQPEEPQAQ